MALGSFTTYKVATKAKDTPWTGRIGTMSKNQQQKKVANLGRTATLVVGQEIVLSCTTSLGVLPSYAIDAHLSGVVL